MVIVRFFKRSMLGILSIIKSFKSPKGLLSFGISFMIFCGWALVFVGFGLVVGDAWFVGIGTTVLAFWALPATPMWILIIALAYFLQKTVFKDKNTLTKEQIINSFKDGGNKHE